MGHRKIIFLIISILVVVGILVFIYEYKDLKNIKKCESINDEQEKNDCLVDYAVSKGDIDACDDFEENLQGTCKRNILIEEENLSGCEELKNSYMLDSQICIDGIARKQNNLDICSQIEIPAIKDTCIKKIALNTNNIEACKQIENELRKDFCYITFAQQMKDIKVCENVTADEQLKLCYKEYELILGETPNCESLDGKYRQTC